MILPRLWVPRGPRFDYGLIWINRSIAASKPDGTQFVRNLFMRQPVATRRRNAYKAAASQMAQKFAARVGVR